LPRFDLIDGRREFEHRARHLLHPIAKGSGGEDPVVGDDRDGIRVLPTVEPDVVEQHAVPLDASPIAAVPAALI